jgi:hypothetical protein
LKDKIERKNASTKLQGIKIEIKKKMRTEMKNQTHEKLQLNDLIEKNKNFYKLKRN